MQQPEGPAQRKRGRRLLPRRPHCRGERGQSLVELSLILPLLLVIVIGLVEVADSFNAYITVVDASRDGARLGSKNLATDAQIKNMIIIETGRLRDPVLNSDITIQHTTFSGVNAINVKVCNNRHLLLHIPVVMPETINMCGQTMMRVLPGSGS